MTAAKAALADARRRYATEYGEFTWHRDPRRCPHENEHVCPTCDFDGYHQRHIEEATT